jgi:ribosomal protein S18 acetylase RimI-like enzyme
MTVTSKWSKKIMGHERETANTEIEGLNHTGHGLYSLDGYTEQVTVRIHVANPLEWHLMSLQVDPSLRGRGLASRLLHTVCGAADKDGAVLYLAVEELEPIGLDFDQLVSWYKRYGFVFEEEAVQYMMVRPQIHNSDT